MTEPSPRPQLKTSTRDREQLRLRLNKWLEGKLDDPEVGQLTVPESNGMSSETLLFDVTFSADGRRRNTAMAARLSPDPSAAPVFPVYDLERQYRVMTLARERSGAPIPTTFWFEPDESALGATFFVMERVTGEVPPDVMPYPFGSWLTEATEEQRQRLQRAAVGVLAQIHQMQVSAPDTDFLQLHRPGRTALERHVADLASYYEWVTSDGVRSPLIERGFEWLRQNWPLEEGPTVVSWGDARIGNMLFRNFRPVAVLDWEMAAVGPAEIDLGWMIYLHRFLDDIAISAGMSGMGRFMHMEDVSATYEALTGRAPMDLEFYCFYAALRHAVIMSRVARRQVLFGEIEMPEDPDDMILHRASVEQMLEGTYWQQF